MEPCQAVAEVENRQLECILDGPHEGKRHKSIEGWEWGSKKGWKRRISMKVKTRENVVIRASKAALRAAGRTSWDVERAALKREGSKRP